MSNPADVAVVVPVYRNAATLRALHARLGETLAKESWALRLVVDACPAGSGEVADALAAEDPRVHVTHLDRNGGQHAALIAGLRAEPQAQTWVVLDADLQDPPEAVSLLLARLRAGDVAGVFAGRRGTYESVVRLATGGLHRRALRALTGVPCDAGAYLVLDARLRAAVIRAWSVGGAPSVVAAVGMSGLPLTSISVRRDIRTEGHSAWTSRARLRHGLRTLGWALRQRLTTPRMTSPGMRIRQTFARDATTGENVLTDW